MPALLPANGLEVGGPALVRVGHAQLPPTSTSTTFATGEESWYILFYLRLFLGSVVVHIAHHSNRTPVLFSEEVLPVITLCLVANWIFSTYSSLATFFQTKLFLESGQATLYITLTCTRAHGHVIAHAHDNLPGRPPPPHTHTHTHSPKHTKKIYNHVSW